MSLLKLLILNELDARILWSLLIEPGDQVAHDFINEFDTAREAVIFVMSQSPISGQNPRQLDYAEGLERWRSRLSDVGSTLFEAVTKTVAELNITVLIPGDDLWPERVNRLGNKAPVVLYVRGNAGLLAQDAIALVGARAATGYGEHVTMEFAAGLAQRDYVTVSGAAYGIDAVAHRATLAANGATIAVLAGGVDRAIPIGNDQLLNKIASAGAVVSELPPGAAPTKSRFLERNRLIAALSIAVVVIEAGARSGVLDTAHRTLELGVPLGAVPGPITSPTSAGCHRLLRAFVATCVTSTDEVMALIPASKKASH